MATELNWECFTIILVLVFIMTFFGIRTRIGLVINNSGFQSRVSPNQVDKTKNLRNKLTIIVFIIYLFFLSFIAILILLYIIISVVNTSPYS